VEKNDQTQQKKGKMGRTQNNVVKVRYTGVAGEHWRVRDNKNQHRSANKNDRKGGGAASEGHGLSG